MLISAESSFITACVEFSPVYGEVCGWNAEGNMCSWAILHKFDHFDNFSLLWPEKVANYFRMFSMFWKNNINLFYQHKHSC